MFSGMCWARKITTAAMNHHSEKTYRPSARPLRMNAMATGIINAGECLTTKVVTSSV